MFAQFFFLTLYMQNILHYSPLETGLRFLPSTLVIIVMGPLAGRLTDRVGPRPLMTLGLVIVALARCSSSRASPSTAATACCCPGSSSWASAWACDVADEHRRDERRRPHQGGRRLRRAVDEPDGRQHVRRRRDGRARGGDRPLARSTRASPTFRPHTRAAIANAHRQRRAVPADTRAPPRSSPPSARRSSPRSAPASRSAPR